MVMFLLKLLSPKEIPSRKTAWDWRVRFYKWLLVELMPVYRRSAIADTVNLDTTQIIHNVRDYWYEQELQRFHIDVAQHLEKQNVSCNLKRKYRRSSLFNWSETLLLFHDGKSYAIKRAKNFAIETDMNGQLKMSTDKDFIFRSEFTAKNTGRIHENQNEREKSYTAPAGETPFEDRNEQPRQKINIKDTIPNQKNTETFPPETTKYRGFEENNLF